MAFVSVRTVTKGQVLECMCNQGANDELTLPQSEHLSIWMPNTTKKSRKDSRLACPPSSFCIQRFLSCLNVCGT